VRQRWSQTTYIRTEEVSRTDYFWGRVAIFHANHYFLNTQINKTKLLHPSVRKINKSKSYRYFATASVGLLFLALFKT